MISLYTNDGQPLIKDYAINVPVPHGGGIAFPFPAGVLDGDYMVAAIQIGMALDSIRVKSP